MSAAIDYRERAKALRAKFFPPAKPVLRAIPPKDNIARLYGEPIGPPRPQKIGFKRLYRYPIGPENHNKGGSHFSEIFREFEAQTRPKHSAGIIKEVCDVYSVTHWMLCGDSRRKNITLARSECYYRLRMETKLSTAQIGKILNRDHTTIIHGSRSYACRNRLPMP